MNTLSWLFVTLAGTVSTVSALAILGVILLVLAQVSTLLYRRLMDRRLLPATDE